METEEMAVFIRKVLACDTMTNLERLHTMVRKSVSASQRGVYIRHLNDREDIIMKGEDARMAWSDE